MEKKLIISLAVLVVVMGVITIFTHIGVPSSLLPDLDATNKDYKDYSEQVEICEDLSEEECFKNNNCVGNYGSSHSGEGFSTTDMVFKSCKPSGLNSEEIQQIKIECAKIGGEFRQDKIGGFECLCKKPDYIGKDRCLEDLIHQLKTN